jgi:hypothetical protein
MTTETKVVRLPKGQIREGGRVLGRAFHDDPVPRCCCPDHEKRVPRLAWFMTVAARYGHMYGGEVYTTAGRVEGVAV